MGRGRWGDGVRVRVSLGPMCSPLDQGRSPGSGDGAVYPGLREEE